MSAEYTAAIFRVEWCVLWSVYVGVLIDSETHVICRPWRWRLYIHSKCWCPSAVL